MIDSVDALFDALGGPAMIGAVIGKSTEHAASMRRRGSVPVVYWPAIIADARARDVEGVTYEALTLMHAKATEPARVAS